MAFLDPLIYVFAEPYIFNPTCLLGFLYKSHIFRLFIPTGN